MSKKFIFIILIFWTYACNQTSINNTQIPTELALLTRTQAVASATIKLFSTDTPIPLSTLTLTPSETPQPTAFLASTQSSNEIATVEPRPTIPLGDTSLPGKIYVWHQPFYGYLDPNKSFQEEITRVGQQFPQGETPEKAVTVAFSNYSQQVAYILETTDQKINLWIADLEILLPNSIWIDNENLSGYSPGDIWLWVRWGLGDQFILLENISLSGTDEGDYFWVVYALKSNTASSLTGPCVYLFISPQSGEFSVGCPISETDFVVLEQDGTQWNVDTLPETSIYAKDWVIAPDGNQVVYANEEDEIFVMNKEGQQIKLPVSYQWGSAGVVMQTLQWSQNSLRLLIFGDDLNHCPYSSFAERIPPCWQVFDSGTGELIWQQNDVSGFIATISPDGQWIVMFHLDPTATPIARWGAVYSVNDNSATIIYNFVVGAVSWGE